MRQILLAFIAIRFVNCELYCPGFSNYQNNVDLVDYLDGELMVVYSTCNVILTCERASWTVGPDNNRTASLKDSNGCCRRIDNFDNSNPDYLQLDITPLNSCNYLQSTEKVYEKLVGVTGTGMDLCLIVYICQPSRYGLFVACRQQPQLWLWIEIGNILRSLLNLLVPTPIFTRVNQSNCIFSNNCVY